MPDSSYYEDRSCEEFFEEELLNYMRELFEKAFNEEEI